VLGCDDESRSVESGTLPIMEPSECCFASNMSVNAACGEMGGRLK
jgi:hypothetical protein